MHHRRDRVEEGQRVAAGLLGDGGGEGRGGERSGGDDRGAGGQRVDARADDLHPGMGQQGGGDRVGETFAVDGQRGPCGNSGAIAFAQDQATERPHFLVQQPDRVRIGVVGSETVRADQFGK